MGRSPCCAKAHTNKGAWTKEEDDCLTTYIKAHGEGCWRALPKAAGLMRCGKSCRLRWMNYLRPDVKRGNFTSDEDELIIHFHSILGNKWSMIASKLPGRTDNEIRNYWNTHIKRKLLNRGVDPATHKPLKEAPPMATSTVDHLFDEEIDHNNNNPTCKSIPFGKSTTAKTNTDARRVDHTGYSTNYMSLFGGFQASSSSSSSAQMEGENHEFLGTEVISLELKISPPERKKLVVCEEERLVELDYCTTSGGVLGDIEMRMKGQDCSCSGDENLSSESGGFDFLRLQCGGGGGGGGGDQGDQIN